MEPLLSVLALDDPMDGSLSDLASRLRVLREHKQALTDLEAALELEVAARMEEDRMPIHGVGLVRRFKAKRTTWREKHSSAALRSDLKLAISRKIGIDQISGEVNELYRRIADATMDLAYDVIPSFSSFKQAGWKLGLDLEDYRETTEYDAIEIEASPTVP